MLKFISILVATVLLVPFAASANPNAPARLIKVALAQKLKLPEAQKLLVPVAQFYRVDEGVFELGENKTIDLTDRKILLGVKCYKNHTGDKRCDIYLNGNSVRSNGVGSRFNLKNNRSTKAFIEDKDICVLDLVDAVLPKGAKAIFTFRLNCP
jgi:hypothetical protein